MSFQVSPGVIVKEIDRTNVVPAVSTSIGGYAGAFKWGPVDYIDLISSEKELAKSFGAPSGSVSGSFSTAASFLKYSNALKVVRSVGANAKNATSGAGGSFGLLIKNEDHYEENFIDGSAAVGAYGAKYPGVLGNSLKVSVCPADQTAFDSWEYAYLFNSAPSTSEFASQLQSANDEMHIVVIDTLGSFSGSPGTVLEKYEYVSQASDGVKSDGTSNYFKNVINSGSNYIWFLDHESLFVNSGSKAIDTPSFAVTNNAYDYQLSGAVDADPTSGNIAASLDLFADAETVEVNLLFASPDASGETTIANTLITIAEARNDIIAFISPPLDETVNNISAASNVKTWADGLSSSSYVVLDSSAAKVYDKYNDEFLWIPLSGHIAGLCAKTDDVADVWFSPAGVNRGQILGITKLAFNPKKADRDTLYKARVNPVVSLPGQGTLLYGDKTALAKPSAFDRINVRRLFITLEKAISIASKYQLFEFNDEFTRANFRNMVEPFLRNVQGRRGITDFRVVCDSTNNTGEIIDTNNFVADIYIKPARSINYISLNFIATRTGVEFSEIVGA